MSSSNETQYYENAAIWDPARYADIETQRARTTIAWLPEAVHSVLDAGCGNGVLTNLLQGMDLRVGLDRSLAALQWLQAPGLQGDLAALPFGDGAFDAVVTTEVIEHLPVSLYARGLHELARTARHYVIVSVPYCEDLEAFRVTCPACGCRFHRTYHMRRFEQEDMVNLFPVESGLRLLRLEGIFPVPRPRGAALRHSWHAVRRHLFHAQGRLAPAALCPQCGFGAAASSGRARSRPAPTWRVYVSKVATRLMPPVAVPRWWLALYGR